MLPTLGKEKIRVNFIYSNLRALIFFPNSKPQDNEPESKKSGKETVIERVHRHLNDKRSEITDEDIQNVLVEWDARENFYEGFLAFR